MAETLTQEEIKLYDDFISKNIPQPSKTCGMPNSSRREGREVYKQIKNATGPQLYILHSEAMGFASYSLYKSSNNKMYILYTYNNIPQLYYNC
jgi:hypothetical protein